MARSQRHSGSPNGGNEAPGRERLLCVHCLEDLEWRSFGEENSLRAHQGRVHNCWHKNPLYRCNRCARYFDQSEDLKKHGNLPNCLHPRCMKHLKTHPDMTHPGSLQRRADVCRTKEDGEMNPALIVPAGITWRGSAEIIRRRDLVAQRYGRSLGHNVQIGGPTTAVSAPGNAAQMPMPPAGPQMHPLSANNGNWPAAPTFAMPASHYNAAIRSGPAQSFQQPQQLPQGQGTNMLQNNLGQFGGAGSWPSGMAQSTQPSYSQQQQDPHAFTGGMDQLGQQQVFNAPPPMQQGYGNSVPGNAYPVPNHLGGAHGAALDQQLQHQELQVGGYPRMMHLHNPAFNSMVFPSPARPQGSAGRPGRAAGPAGTSCGAGRRRSAGEALAGDPERAARGAGQQQGFHYPPAPSQAPGMQRSQSMASQLSPRTVNAQSSAGGAHHQQQMAPHEPEGRRAVRQPVKRSREHDPGSVNGDAVRGHAQRQQQRARQEPESQHPPQQRSVDPGQHPEAGHSCPNCAASRQPVPTSSQSPGRERSRTPPVRAVSRQDPNSHAPPRPQQRTPPVTQESATQQQGAGTHMLPSQEGSDPVLYDPDRDVNDLLAWWDNLSHEERMAPATGPAAAAAAAVQDPQPVQTASQGSGVATSSATMGPGDETLAADGSSLEFDEFINFDG